MAISYDRAPAARSPQTAPRGGVQKMGGASGLADVLSVILKEGIVIDAWVRVSIIGIEILTVEIRAVIASVDTYLRYAEAIGLTALAAAPRTMEPVVPPSNGSPRGLPPAGTPNYSPISGLSNSGLPGLPSMTGPSDDEILAYLEAHPDGVRLSELQAYFGSDRTALESILNRLVQQDTAVLDAQRGLYRPAHVLAPAIP